MLTLKDGHTVYSYERRCSRKKRGAYTRKMNKDLIRKKLSYDIRLKDPVTYETLTTNKKHLMIGGTQELWLNITYNYAKHYYRVFGEKGIRFLYGLTGAQSIDLLEAGIAMLGDAASNDYWEAALKGNAKRALYQLLAMAQMEPDGIWDGN